METRAGLRRGSIEGVARDSREDRGVAASRPPGASLAGGGSEGLQGPGPTPVAPWNTRETFDGVAAMCPAVVGRNGAEWAALAGGGSGSP